MVRKKKKLLSFLLLDEVLVLQFLGSATGNIGANNYKPPADPYRKDKPVNKKPNNQQGLQLAED